MFPHLEIMQLPKTVLNKSIVGITVWVELHLAGTTFLVNFSLLETRNFPALTFIAHQVTWMGEEADLEATDWGWKTEENQFIPVMNEMNAAPDSLLKVVHCNCTTGCSTQRCTCRTYGLPCTSACGQCQVQSCSNPFNQMLGDENENDDNDNAEMISGDNGRGLW